MTKEEFKTTAIKYARNGALLSLSTLISDFFKSNVCIPKGENPHKFSKELHALAEGIECEYKLGNSFVLLDNLGIIRIKPSEPIYEWQCLYAPQESFEYRLTSHMTESEIMGWKSTNGSGWKIEPIEKTKKERK